MELQSIIMIKDRPGKITEIFTSKTGKHGHAKIHIVAIDIFTGKKLEMICPSTHTVEVPNVKYEEYTFLDISEDGFITLMNIAGDTREDLTVPDGEIKTQIKKLQSEDKEIYITVIKACGQEAIISVKSKK